MFEWLLPSFRNVTSIHHNLPRMRCTRFIPFVVLYFGHPFRSPHLRVRLSSLPDSRQPSLSTESDQTGVSATIIDRAISVISTVKVFSAVLYETFIAIKSFNNFKSAATRLNLGWGFTSGWLNSSCWPCLFNKRKQIGAGDVMAVFLACLIAACNLQICIPQFIILTKGKFAIAVLLGVVDSKPSSPVSASSRKLSRKFHLRKVIPSKCSGELALKNVS